MQKNIKIILSVIFVITVLLSSCHKKKDDPTPSSSNNNNGSTSNTGSYLPLTPGNVWNYDGDDTYTSTVTNKTKTINGKAYSILVDVVQPSSTPDSTYAFQDGNKYYSYSQTSAGPLELKIIDLDLPIGTTWSTGISSNASTDVTYTFKVTGTGLTRTVNSVAYNDVISVQLETTTALSPSYIQTLKSYGIDDATIAMMQAQYAAYDFVQTTYYAKNVGLIEQTSTTSGLNVHLVSSIIK